MQQIVCISYELLDYMELLTMSLGTGARLLGGVTALLKVEGGIVGKYVANECVKIMGG